MPRPRFVASLALAALAVAPLPAQLTPQQDPANLAGERVSPQDPADTLPINHGALALQQLLRKLQTRASLMLIVAHPDDEDGGMLTYYSRGQGARVAMLTLNRGEGGQNLMSADFNDALGLIRTQELLAAGRYMGVDQFFGTEVDFGFSKTKEESFAKWGHERVLYDAVRAVRLYRPLVIASVFIGGPTDGHGQHQISGEIAQEVFKAAGDPNVFPDMAREGLVPWQPLKVYARIPFARIDEHGMYDYATNQYVPVRFHNYVTGKDSASLPKTNVTIPEGTPDALLDGKTYVQFARMGLALQKSQIGQAARPAPPGRSDVQYHRYGSKLNQPDGDESGDSDQEKSFFDGIDTSIAGIAELAPSASSTMRVVLISNLSGIDHSIANAAADFKPEQPQLAAPRLREALAIVDHLAAEVDKSSLPTDEKASVSHELRIKRVQIENALILSLQITLEAGSDPVDVTPGSTLRLDVRLEHTGDTAIAYKGTTIESPDAVDLAAQRGQPDQLGTVYEFRTSIAIPDAMPLTRPYFSRPNLEQPFYDVSDPNLRNAPATPYPLVAVAHLNYGGSDLTLKRTLHVFGPGREATTQATVVVPRISIAMLPSLKIVASGETHEKPLDLNIAIRTNLPKMGPRIKLSVPDGWKLKATKDDFVNEAAGETHMARATVTPLGIQPGGGSDGRLDVKASAIDLEPGQDHKEYKEGYRTVGYPGLTPTNYFRPATLRVVGLDIHIAPNLRVAYLQGTGDDVPAYLPDLGVTPTILTVADLNLAKLSQFDTVVLGVRAYAAHPELAGAGSRPLFDFAAAGGTVIVQYNNGRYGAGEAPYPISVAMSSGDHAHDVVDEAEPVTILAPDTTLLNFPNRITAADFDHWVEERGHGFAGSWAPEYQALLETHDPGQEPQRGGLLVAPVGKGYYVYCGLALYRQLPEGVPGAYRLYANLLSLPKAPRN